MKLRNGFVSNSSSSSFIVALKNKDADLKATLEKLFKLEDHPLSGLAKQAVGSFLNSAERKTVRDFVEDDEYDTIEDYVDRGYTSFYDGSFSDEEGGIEAMLCNMDLNYEDENIIIEKEGGY